MGVRENAGPITGNLSSFVPHFFANWKRVLRHTTI